MLIKNPLTRLCKPAHIKAHAYFNGFNWESLISLDFKVPYLPVIKDKPIDNTKVIPYNTYIKVNHYNFYFQTVKEYEVNGEIDKKDQADYDKWFKRF